MMPRSRYSATAEVSSKTDAQIERQVAKTHAGRAKACFEKAVHTGKSSWVTRGQRWMDEALEHASQTETQGRLVGQLERKLKPLRAKAQRAVAA